MSECIAMEEAKYLQDYKIYVYEDLEWNDYDLAFSIYDLYQNKIV